MEIWQLKQAADKAGLHASGKNEIGYRCTTDPSGKIIKITSVVLHNDPLDHKKEIILPPNHPRYQALLDAANAESVKL